MKVIFEDLHKTRVATDTNLQSLKKVSKIRKHLDYFLIVMTLFTNIKQA